MRTILIFLFISITCNSCLVSYGDYLSTEYTPINPAQCEPTPGNVYLFFEDEDLDFEYTRLGHVEAIGERFSDNQEILENLKYTAWENCANGVIQIKKGSRYRREGMGLTNTEEDIVYDANTFHGIAVQIETDSAFLAKYGSLTQATFVANIRQRQEKEKKQAQSQVIMSALLGAGTVALAILAASIYY
jgi:hypothetical protein